MKTLYQKFEAPLQNTTTDFNRYFLKVYHGKVV